MSRFTNLAEIDSNQGWVSEIDEIRAELKSCSEIKSEREGVSALKRVLLKSIEKSIKTSEQMGVLFSGGIDSTLVAFCLKQELGYVNCYAVGTRDSDDIAWAERVSRLLGFNLTKRILSEKEIERIIKLVVCLLNDSNPVNIGVATVIYAGIETAKDSDVVFSGLGSEEIFAGYHRHAVADNINSECWRGLYNMWKRDMVRDRKIADTFDVRLELPFLGREMIKTAMLISGELKIRENSKKYILRKLAEEIEIPREIAHRPKRAAQYGSFVDRVMGKLARRSGFKYKRDYLNSLLTEVSSEYSSN